MQRVAAHRTAQAGLGWWVGVGVEKRPRRCYRGAVYGAGLIMCVGMCIWRAALLVYVA